MLDIVSRASLPSKLGHAFAMTICLGNRPVGLKLEPPGWDFDVGEATAYVFKGNIMAMRPRFSTRIASSPSLVPTTQRLLPLALGTWHACIVYMGREKE